MGLTEHIFPWCFLHQAGAFCFSEHNTAANTMLMATKNTLVVATASKNTLVATKNALVGAVTTKKASLVAVTTQNAAVMAVTKNAMVVATASNTSVATKNTSVVATAMKNTSAATKNAMVVAVTNNASVVATNTSMKGAEETMVREGMERGVLLGHCSPMDSVACPAGRSQDPGVPWEHLLWWKGAQRMARWGWPLQCEAVAGDSPAVLCEEALL